MEPLERRLGDDRSPCAHCVRKPVCSKRERNQQAERNSDKSQSKDLGNDWLSFPLLSRKGKDPGSLSVCSCGCVAINGTIDGHVNS